MTKLFTPVKFLLLATLLFVLSCQKEQSKKFSEDTEFMIYKSWLRKDGAAFKDGYLKVRSKEGKIISGILDWNKTKKYTYKNRDYVEVPYLFKNEIRIVLNENTVSGFNLVFRSSLNGEIEAAIRMTYSGDNIFLDERGKTIKGKIQSYTLINGDKSTLWVSVEGFKGKQKINRNSGKDAVKKKANNESVQSSLFCPMLYFRHSWVECFGGSGYSVNCEMFDYNIYFALCYGDSHTGDYDEPDDWVPEEEGPVDPVVPIIPLSEEALKATLKDKPFILFSDIPCYLLKQWLSTVKQTVSPSLIDKLSSIKNLVVLPGPIGAPVISVKYIASVQKIDDAYSAVVNMDYFPVTVSQLPIINGSRATAPQFLNFIRKNINIFVDTDYSKFTPYHWYGVDDAPLWYSNDPKGAVIAIDIKGPDNGSVIVSHSGSDKWTFTTIHDPKYGDHPVSGNRDFSFTQNTDGSYTFFTRGVDRLTNPSTDAIGKLSEFLSRSNFPFTQAENLWTSFQTKVNKFVNDNNGSSIVNTKQNFYPDWSVVKDVLNGSLPLNYLSKDCP